MEAPETVRKVRYRQGSLVVTIPKKMAAQLGLGRSRYVRIGVAGGRIIVSPVVPGQAKVDEDRTEREDSGDAWPDVQDGAARDRSAAGEHNPDGGGRGRLDGLRM